MILAHRPVLLLAAVANVVAIAACGPLGNVAVVGIEGAAPSTTYPVIYDAVAASPGEAGQDVDVLREAMASRYRPTSIHRGFRV